MLQLSYVESSAHILIIRHSMSDEKVFTEHYEWFSLTIYECSIYALHFIPLKLQMAWN